MAETEIYIYPDTPSDEGYSLEVFDAITTAFDYIENTALNVDFYSAATNNVYPDCQKSSTRAFKSCWDQFVEDNLSDVSGCHLLVTTDNSIGGWGDLGSGFGSNEDAWVGTTTAVSGQAGPSLEANKAIAIQEVLHTMTDTRSCQEWDRRGFSRQDSGHEHDLGTVNSDNEVTPMAASYEDSHLSHGHCSADSATGFTFIPSDCTIRAIEATIRNNFNSSPSSGERDWAIAQYDPYIDGDWEGHATFPKYEYPVAIMGPLSIDGQQPAFTRMRDYNQDNETFDYRLQEWDYQDGSHYNESVGWAIFNDGKIRDDGGYGLEAGMNRSIDDSSHRVHFDHQFQDFSTPVVVTQPMTYNGNDGVVTRITDIEDFYFDVFLQEQESSSGNHTNEKIGYLAGRRGSREINGQPYEVGGVQQIDHTWTGITFDNNYAQPVFLADVQTFNGSDPVCIRYRNLTNNTVEIRLQEEQSSDDETEHGKAEGVGYFVFEEGSISP